ncbi:MAG: hypothetical protein Ct9H90mP20_6390 [Candidatus Neomarinimicrobiota bacterium]|nr:MAG: hypothetical protein Ct9H90mP20_6390 [Candidatus Neomarinimicrobiota bacterium]
MNGQEETPRNLLFGFNIGTSFDDKKLNFDFDWNISLYNRKLGVEHFQKLALIPH